MICVRCGYSVPPDGVERPCTECGHLPAASRVEFEAAVSRAWVWLVWPCLAAVFLGVFAFFPVYWAVSVMAFSGVLLLGAITSMFLPPADTRRVFRLAWWRAAGWVGTPWFFAAACVPAFGEIYRAWGGQFQQYWAPDALAHRVIDLMTWGIWAAAIGGVVGAALCAASVFGRYRGLLSPSCVIALAFVLLLSMAAAVWGSRVLVRVGILELYA